MINIFPVIDKRKTGVNLRRIMDERGLTVKDVKEYLHLGSVQSIYHWLNGECLPSVDNLYAMSQLFQISVDDLLCGNRRILTVMESAQCARIFSYCTKWKELCAA